MLISILKLIFGKVIGLDKIPDDKKQLFWQKVADYSVRLAGEMAERAARGGHQVDRDQP